MPTINNGQHGDKSQRRGIRLFLWAVVVCMTASAARAQVYEVVYDFGDSLAFDPHGPLIRGSDGHLYGTTGSPGSEGGQLGTVFRLNRRGSTSVTFLHDFLDLGDGANPMQSLLESSGYLFGSTTQDFGGCFFNAAPSTFRIDFVGNLSTITCGISTADMSGLIEAFGGGLVGMDQLISGLYRLDVLGNVTPLNSFGGNYQAAGELLLASDGNVYGVTGPNLDQFNDEDFNSGVLFRSDGAGNVTFMHEFQGQEGHPFGRLVEQGGFLWGTTTDGGDFGHGMMFRMDFAGNFATLHSFAGGAGDGARPTGGLLVANNSSFYGTTQKGGQYDAGTLYQIDSFGNVVIWHSFGDVGDGSDPGPLLAVNGALWGTTQSGGATGAGTIYTLIPSSGRTVLRLTPTAGPVLVRPGDPVQIHGGVFPVGEVPSVLVGGLPASNVQLLDQQDINAATPPDLAPGTLNEIIIVLPDGTQASLEKAWMADFLDVPQSDRRHGSVERVFRAGLMDGCGGGNFCEAGTTDRAALVTMSLKAKHGPAWAPPSCTGVFKDVACPGPQADWVEDAVAEGIAQPCGRDRFCPDRKLTRDDEAAILLKTEHGGDYVPPACTGIFKDVKCPGPQADAIEQAYDEGVVGACATSPLRYCPNGRVERGALAESVAKAYRLP